MQAGNTKAEIKADNKDLVKSNDGFAFDLYGRLRSNDGNLFFSPYSISNALAMTTGGARGDTLAQMEKTLHFGMAQDKLHDEFRRLIDSLNADAQNRKFKLSVANALWCQKGYGFEKSFLKLTESNYHAALKQVSFTGNSEKARQDINHWVEEQTKDKIKDLIKPGDLDADTRLVLTNAIYFKAAWMHQFNKAVTKEDEFTTASRPAKAQFMHQLLDSSYMENDEVQMLELPYEAGQLNFLVILPKKADGLADVEKGLNADTLALWTSKLANRRVDISLPKFKTTSEFGLGDTLAKMGMPLAFSPGADFSGITKDEKLFLSKVVHKAFVDVDENGTEAAAATGVIVKRVAAQANPNPPVVFKANHPFIYLIRDSATGSILFMGRLANPQG